MLTFRNVIENLKPSVVFVEETKFVGDQTLKLDGYVPYHKNRTSANGGGGVLLAVRVDLQPSFVRDGADKAEAISVVISTSKLDIRCCVAYGCQENENDEKKDDFWAYLDEEVDQAASNNTGFLLQFDGNLWGGESVVLGDPRPQNKNGRLFELFLERHPQLTIVNNLPICEGVITRRRIANNKVEESVLDFFLVCNKVLPFVTNMVIDEKKRHVLTKFGPAKQGRSAIDSDHYTMYIDVSLEALKEDKNKWKYSTLSKVVLLKHSRKLQQILKSLVDVF